MARPTAPRARARRRLLLLVTAFALLGALAPAASLATVPATVGDFDGDGKTDIGLYKLDGSFHVMNQAYVPPTVGTAGDVSVPGDYNGDGKVDLAVWHQADGTWNIQGQAPIAYGQRGDIPVPADYNGDGKTDIAIFKLDGSWHVMNQSVTQYGVRGDIPVPADYNGDGKDEVAVWRPSDGTWNLPGTGQTITYGKLGDIPVPADYNGDGKDEVAVWRPSDGTWNLPGTGQTITYGQLGDTPIPGDFNGDHKPDIAVWRPSDGSWNVMSQGTWYYGTFGDQPLARPVGMAAIDRHKRVEGDFNGDAKTDFGVWKTASGEWHIMNVLFTAYGATGDTPVPYDFNGDTAADVALWKPDFSWHLKDFAYVPPYGATGDVAVKGDFDGDGADDVGVWKPASGEWHIKDKLFAVYGQAGDVPVPADYDGDGKTDIAVWRPSDGTWNVRSVGTWTYGARGDTPVPADYTGDGKADIALWKPDHSWHLMNLQYIANWGQDGDVPAIGDYDADGRADIAIYRPSTAQWYLLDRDTGATTIPAVYGGPTDIPTVRPTGYDVDYAKPAVSISGGLYDARNAASLTDASINVAADDTYSGADRIVVNANRADGTFGPVADSNRDCGSFMCWPRQHSLSTSISPSSLNWQTGTQPIRVDVYDNAGNLTQTSWNVPYYASSWAYGGGDHGVNTVAEADALAAVEDGADASGRSRLWTGLAPADKAYAPGLDPSARYADVDQGIAPWTYDEPENAGGPIATAAAGVQPTPAVAPDGWCVGHVTGIAYGKSNKHKYYAGTTSQTFGFYTVALNAQTFDCDNGRSRTYFSMWWDANGMPSGADVKYQWQMWRRSGQNKPYSNTSGSSLLSLEANTKWQCCASWSGRPHVEMFPMPDGSAGRVDEIRMPIGALGSVVNWPHVIHVPMRYVPIVQP